MPRYEPGNAVKVVINAGYFESLVDKWDKFVDLLAVGFSTALIVVVIVAAVKLGSVLHGLLSSLIHHHIVSLTPSYHYWRNTRVNT